MPSDVVRQGTRGVSMFFYVQVRDDDGNLNNIEVQRLKDKLGTRPVPTAELLLDGTRALLVVNYHCWLGQFVNYRCWLGQFAMCLTNTVDLLISL